MKILPIIVLIFCSQYGWANCTTTYCTGQVIRLYVSETATYVEMDGDMTALNCTLFGGAYATLRNSHINRDAVYALLLAGHTRESTQIKVRISSNTNDCRISYVTSAL